MARRPPTPGLAACRAARCPSLYEARVSRPPERDLVQGGPAAPWWGCAARVGGSCRLCASRPDLTPVGQVGLPLGPAPEHRRP